MSSAIPSPPCDPVLADGGAQGIDARPDLALAFDQMTLAAMRGQLMSTCLLFLVFVGGGDLWESLISPDRIGLVWSSWSLQLLVCTLALRLVWTAEHLHRAAAVAAATFAMNAVIFSGYNALVGGPAERVAIALACLLTALPVTLPIGWRGQLLVSVVALGGLGAATPWLPVSDTIGFSLLGVLTAGFTSTLGAHRLERYRRASFVQTALARESAEVEAALVRAGEALSAHLDRPDMHAAVATLAVETLGCDSAMLFVWVAERRVFRLGAAVGFRSAEIQREVEQIEFSPEILPVVRALVPGALIEIPQPEGQDLLPAALLQRWNASSLLIASITNGDRVIGALVASHRERRGPFPARERRLIVGVVNAAAIALENTRLIVDLHTASRVKSDFVATMSHELRTPLNVILGYNDMLGDESLGALTPAQREIVAKTRRSARELFDLISATLDVNRLEAGRAPTDLGAVSIAELFSEVDQEVRDLVPAGVTLSWHDGLPATPITTDRLKLKMILKNLVGNALKFTDAGAVRVSASAGHQVLRLVVCDTGLGIEPAQLPTIFQMFRQGDGSSTRRHGGVGLGLYIVDRLVRLLGGSIETESTVGAGSTFRVTIPAPELTAPAAVASTAA